MVLRCRVLMITLAASVVIGGPSVSAGRAEAAVPSTVAVGDVVVYEGDAGFTPASISVTLSDPQTADVFVDYAIVAGTASAGTVVSGADVVSRRGRVRFKIGRTSAVITTRIVGDTNPESDESFSVVLSNISMPGLAFRDDTAAVTIRNDDPPVGVAVIALGDTTVYEGDSGSVTAKVTATLSAARPTDLVLAYTTVEGSALGGANSATADFVTRAGRVRIRSGKTSAQLAIKVRADTTSEGDETFAIAVTSTSGAIVEVADGNATVTIADDDPSPLPNVPTGLTVVAGPQNRYLTATWDAPAGGATPTGYDLEVSRAGTTNVLAGVTSSVVFGCGLASVTDTCTMRVRSFNAFGSSQWSEPVTASTWAPPTAPPNLVAVGTAVSWDVPISDQPVLDYWALRSLDNGATWTQVATTTNQHVAAGCSVCLVRVQARSSVGFGPFATVSVNFSLPAPPPAPTDLIVTRDAANPALLHISWTAPPAANPPIEFYDVTINDFVFALTIRDITTTSTDFRQRSPVQVYVSVVARNAAGVSPPVGLLVPAG